MPTDTSKPSASSIERPSLSPMLIVQIIALLVVPFPLLTFTLMASRSNTTTVGIGLAYSTLILLWILIPGARELGGFSKIPGGTIVSLVRNALLYLIFAFIVAQVSAQPLARWIAG